MIRQIFALFFIIILCVGIYFLPQKIKQLTHSAFVRNAKTYLTEQTSSVFEKITQYLPSFLREKEDFIKIEPLCNSSRTVSSEENSPFKQAFNAQKLGFETVFFLEKTLSDIKTLEDMIEIHKRIYPPLFLNKK